LLCYLPAPLDLKKIPKIQLISKNNWHNGEVIMHRFNIEHCACECRENDFHTVIDIEIWQLKKGRLKKYIIIEVL
jgi:hypothetical protein